MRLKTTRRVPVDTEQTKWLTAVYKAQQAYIKRDIFQRSCKTPARRWNY